MSGYKEIKGRNVAIYSSIPYDLRNYRRKFLKRQNINKWKSYGKDTPFEVSQILNCFDRKIKNLPIFNESVRDEYFKGLQEIFNGYYESMLDNQPSKKDFYIKWKADCYVIKGYGAITNMSFKDWKKSFLFYRYKYLPKKTF